MSNIYLAHATFAQLTDSYTANNDNNTQTILGGIAGLIVLISTWRLFSKAGKHGWAAIIPIYSTIVMLRVIRRPLWWIVMLIIPVVNIVFLFMMHYDLAKAFGKGAGYMWLLTLLPFLGYPMLAFEDNQYNSAALKR